jgi:hypothetical protein
VARLLQDKRLETALTCVDHRNVALKLVAMAAIALALAIPACSMLHREKPSPQQQFLEALKRGDSIQASRAWLHMDADDRANLSHGVGFKPDLTPGDVQAAILKHEKEADEKAGGAETRPDEFDQGNSETVEIPGLDMDPKAGSLLSLPSYAAPASSAPAPDGSAEPPSSH